MAKNLDKGSVEQHINALNALIPTMKSFYQILQSGTYSLYLPRFNSNVITMDYLLEVSFSTVYSIANDQVKPYSDIKVIRIEKIILFNELKDYLEKNNLKPLGFDINKLPDKKWLIDVLNTLNPNNAIFKNPMQKYIGLSAKSKLNRLLNNLREVKERVK